MTSFAWIVLATACSAEPAPQSFGSLAEPRSSLHFDIRGPLTEYRPVPGDIVLSTSNKLRTSIVYRAVLVGIPSHAGIVVRMPLSRRMPNNPSALMALSIAPRDAPVIVVRRISAVIFRRP